LAFCVVLQLIYASCRHLEACSNIPPMQLNSSNLITQGVANMYHNTSISMPTYIESSHVNNIEDLNVIIKLGVTKEEAFTDFKLFL
jgi:hypothetical protein